MGKNIYIHIPFCERKCPYCDFYSITDRSVSSSYVDALIKEAEAFSGSGVRPDHNDSQDTLYIGGGTPSSVDAKDIARLVDAVKDLFRLSGEAEITIEVNPSSLTAGKAAIYRDAGINRVSMGVQSLDDDVLKTLGRLHDSEGAKRAIGILQEVFDNISCDLMSGIPGQTLDSLIKSAEDLLSFGIKHISCYSLSLEEGTLFEKRYRDKIEDIVPPETEREMYHKVREVLAKGGLMPYEISNSAIPGYESRHNLNYWAGGNYYAFGAAAAGYLQDVRFTHPSSVSDYIRAADEVTAEDIREYFDRKMGKSDLIVTTDFMTEEEKIKEYPFLALRTQAGMNVARFNELYGKDLIVVFGEVISKNIEAGLLAREGDRIFLTREGLDFADKVIRDMI
ncbi:MAG: radical SAM family heme chaperone HemW [Clostridiales bacterium]|nr:radical SAM family heme chaperone HemW [Clostridiales bacterium]